MKSSIPASSWKRAVVGVRRRKRREKGGGFMVGDCGVSGMW